MPQLDGKVALVTGAARGQGRSHARALAEQGADVIAIDICDQIEVIPYPMGTSQDLAETARQVEALDRRVHAAAADIRDTVALQAAIEAGIDALGPIDIVVANAGVAALRAGDGAYDHAAAFREMIETNLIGTWNTVHLTVPAMIERGAGGSIIITSSTQGLSGRGGDGSGGGAGYVAAKHGLVGLMRTYANWLGPHNIRVNTVHPTGVNTPMVHNEHIERWFELNPGAAAQVANLLPVDLVEPADISNAVVWLAGDNARYVTGVMLPVDAGFSAR